ALGAFLIGGIARVVAVQHSTFFINSLCHTIGKRPYDSSTSARDSWIMALFTFGEGYHNYHHSFQHDYRNGVKPWQWDPSKWTIWTLSKLGLVKGLRRVPEGKILLAEMNEARRRAEERLEELRNAGPSACQRATEALNEAIERVAANYHELEKAVADRVQLSREVLNRWQDETRELVRQIARPVTP